MKGYKYRIYPNSAQAEMIIGTCHSRNFVYNRFLDLHNFAYETERVSLSYQMMNLLLTDLKQDSDCPWLKDADSMALQETLRDLDNAFQNFYEGLSAYPAFKLKRNCSRLSYRTRNQNGSAGIVDQKHVKLPKLGIVKAKVSRFPKGKILNATVSFKSTGKYYVSFCVDEISVKKSCGHEIGIDVGLSEFYTDSNGRKVDNPRHLKKYSRKLAKEQRSLSRKREAAKKDGRELWKSSNYQKQKIKVARVHEKIRNVRNDFLQKTTTALADENQIICVEHLNIKGMVKNHCLAKAISDVSWSKFFTLLNYKTAERNGYLVKVDTFYPSSQTCSECGAINPKTKDLSVRKWICPSCGAPHDRDFNASINILTEGIRILNEPPEEPISLTV